jgi:hypothetical protein
MNPFRGWNAFWFASVSARPLGAFRILYGLIVLAHLGLLANDAVPWLTDAGYLRGGEAAELAGPMRPSPLQWVQDPVSVRCFLASVAGVALLFTVGWQTRIMSILLYLGILSIHNRLLLSVSGADVLLVCTAFYMMLCPCGAAYSLDALGKASRRGGPAEPLIVAWPQRLIQIQLTFVYFMTALLKATGTTWIAGTALHYALHDGEFRRFTLGLTEYPLLTNVLTVGALVLEFALAFLLWFRATRPFAICAGIALHVGILLTVNIPLFEELMISTYVCFLTAPELDAILRAFGIRRWFGRTTSRRPLPDRVRLDSREQQPYSPHVEPRRRRTSADMTITTASSEEIESTIEAMNPVGR